MSHVKAAEQFYDGFLSVQSGFKEWIEKAMVNTLNQVFGKNLNQNNNEGGLQIRSKGDPEDAISF